ncbi:MAG TPA: FHA domain-containing protein [Acidobacteriota bacterium]|nr:FHA domain-containing protein [Acidobacteriota bacterium]
MGMWDALRKAQKKVTDRVETILGYEPEVNPSAFRREMLDRLGSKAVVNANGRSFPFGRVVVRLQPKTMKQHAAFEEAFVREDALKSYLEHGLKEEQIRCPENFQVRVELRDVSSPEGENPGPEFELDCIRLNVLRLEDVPEVKLVVTRGAAERQTYQLKKERILIGRPAEVLDREGRIVRKNDIVFLENEDEIGASVANAHARIWHDFERRGFWIMDEGSRYGTRIMRTGSIIEVPGGEPDGIQLQSGDDLFFGQAGLHFEML